MLLRSINREREFEESEGVEFHGVVCGSILKRKGKRNKNGKHGEPA